MSAVDSREMLARMAGVAQLRASQRADPLHAARVTQVRSFQVRRFEHTYADLLHDPRHGAAARFFLEELYAARSFDERDAQFTRVIPAVGRVFPQEVVHTVVRLTELLALSESLDDRMAHQLTGDGHGALSAAGYAAAWRATGEALQRQRQIALTLDIGADLDRYTRSRAIGMTLKLMRRPARAAGLAALQQFLETGFEAFARIGGAEGFLRQVEARETALAAALFAAPFAAPFAADAAPGATPAWAGLLPA